MLKYGLIACFNPVIKVDIGEHNFDGPGSAKIGSWKMEKIRVLAIQKVAKTGNIGKKKLLWQAISIMKDTSACRRLTWIKCDDAWKDTRLKVNKY